MKKLATSQAMLKNARRQLQLLNKREFSDEEWKRFCGEYLYKASDKQIDKTRKIHNDYIYDFVFDDGHIQNIYLVNKKDIAKNKLQVISQFEQAGTHATKRDKNSFDFTMNWANSKNALIKDLKDFTATFFQRNTLLSVLLHYSVFDISNNLLIMVLIR